MTELLAQLGMLLRTGGRGREKQSCTTAALVPSSTLEPASFTRQVTESVNSYRMSLQHSTSTWGKHFPLMHVSMCVVISDVDVYIVTTTSEYKRQT